MLPSDRPLFVGPSRPDDEVPLSGVTRRRRRPPRSSTSRTRVGPTGRSPADSSRALRSAPPRSARHSTFRRAPEPGSATGTGVSTWSLDFGDGSAPATGVGQPTTVAHTYNAGHWNARLTVGDATGNEAVVTTAVIAAGAPTISEGNATAVTSSTASLPGWVYTSGIVGTCHFEWGATMSYGSRTPTLTLPALDYTQAVTTGLTGLAHATLVLLAPRC